MFAAQIGRWHRGPGYGRVMGRIIYDTAASMNGWIADEDNSLDWLFEVAGADDVPEELSPPAAAVMVMGAHTYEWVLGAEELLEHPEKWQHFHGEVPTFVFTSRQLPIPAGADIRLVQGSVESALPRLRAAAREADIWIAGGGDLAGQFADCGALDEIRLSIAPVSLTGGAPLLPRRLGAHRLQLVAASQVGQFVRVTYEVRGS